MLLQGKRGNVNVPPTSFQAYRTVSIGKRVHNAGAQHLAFGLNRIPAISRIIAVGPSPRYTCRAMPNPQPLEPPLEPKAIERLTIQPGQIVADFGAGGSANWAVKLSQLVGDTGQVIMFDVRKEALAAALNMTRLRGLPNCRGVWSNLEIYRGAQGVADNSLDAGIMINVLNESRHPKDILAEIQRMLKPQAPLLIIDWVVDTTHRLAPSRDHRMAPEYIASLATSLGYGTLEHFAPSDNYWGLIVVKS